MSGETAEQWHQRVTRELREQLIDDGAIDDLLLARLSEEEATARAKHLTADAYYAVQAAVLTHARRVLDECDARRQQIKRARR